MEKFFSTTLSTVSYKHTFSLFQCAQNARNQAQNNPLPGFIKNCSINLISHFPVMVNY